MTSIQTNKQPCCPYGNQAKYVCVNPNCRKSAIICQKAELTQSQCWLFHQTCPKVKWTEIQSFSKENLHAKTPEFYNLQQKIQSLFLKTLQKIQSQHQKFKIWMKTFGHNLQSMKFIKILLDKNYSVLTGQYMSNIIPILINKENKKIQTPIIIENDYQLIKLEIDKVLEKISGLYLKMKKQNLSSVTNNPQQSDIMNQSQNYVISSSTGLRFNPNNNNRQQTSILNFKQKQLLSNNQNNYNDQTINISSKIIDNFSSIDHFFKQKKIKSVNLIYRASENNFSIKKFHQICDNIPDTLTLIHNQYNRKFGGYTPVAWTSDKKHWVADKSLRSFIFSLDMNQKFKLNLAQFAIASNPQRGPTFGCCDICIMDNSNKVQSNCQFPISYNNNGKYVRSQNTSNLFTGNNKGQFFIKQWEVYKMQFQ